MLPPNHEKMAPDGAGGDSSAAGRLDDAHLRVTVEPAEPLEAAAALTREAKLMREKPAQAATQRLTSLKEQQGSEIQARV